MSLLTEIQTKIRELKRMKDITAKRNEPSALIQVALDAKVEILEWLEGYEVEEIEKDSIRLDWLNDQLGGAVVNDDSAGPADPGGRSGQVGEAIVALDRDGPAAIEASEKRGQLVGSLGTEVGGAPVLVEIFAG